MRNRSFHHSHEPFRSRHSLQIDDAHTTGPLPFLNPTRARAKHAPPLQFSTAEKDHATPPSSGGAASPTRDALDAPNIQLNWRSRDNRKGRHALLVESSSFGSAPYVTPKPTSTLHATWQGIKRMSTQYPYWDVSYLVAVIFTLGSVTKFGTEILYGGGITAFIGATIFEIGSVLLMLEAINENRTGCFGWALEKLVESDGENATKVMVRPDKDTCSHHHTNKRNLVGKGDVKPPASSLSTASSVSLHGCVADQPKQPEYTEAENRSWVWFPSAQELKSHYLRELGFLACLAQLTGASVFWIWGFTALPGINNKLGSQGLLDGIYWAPQIVGGAGFIISGLLFILETQSKWYQPAFGVLGWHIGFWNLVGAFGFTLCGALGLAYGNSGAEYQASLATFWGSWAFLIGSVIQWYESLDKYPVATKPVENVQKT
ncbi:hypothetical protein G7Y79_00020g049270 [Physcia stellaris]|nr:hypothetical protein G7Y79_00020g049270 [Physcia stellaris]